jgi:hypothetical protein
MLGYLSETDNSRRREALASEAVSLQRGDVQQPAVMDDRERLSSFYGGFFSVAELPVRLRRLSELAAGRGVALQRTDYRSALETGTPLLRTTLVTSIDGEFGSIHVWLADVLREMPDVALESLHVTRATVDSTTVEADVRLQLYLRRLP